MQPNCVDTAPSRIFEFLKYLLIGLHSITSFTGHVQKGALDANDSAVLQLSVKRFDEAIQQIRGLVGDIRTAVTKIGGTVNSGEAIRALENAPSEMDVVKHAELTKMRKSITQDVDEFRMRWKDLIQTILSIEDSKSPEIVEDWGKEVVA